MSFSVGRVITFLDHTRGRVTVFLQEIGGGHTKTAPGKRKLHQPSPPLINDRSIKLSCMAFNLRVSNHDNSNMSFSSTVTKSALNPFREIYSQLSRKRTPSRIEKKCPLLELPAYENYLYKRTPKKNRVDVCLRER